MLKIEHNACPSYKNRSNGLGLNRLNMPIGVNATSDYILVLTRVGHIRSSKRVIVR